MILHFQWGNPVAINLVILVVYSIMAFLMWRTFKEGQRQSDVSLSISQFNTLNNDLKTLISEAKNIKFISGVSESFLKPFKNNFERSNSINNIYLFLIPDTINFYEEEINEKKECQ